MTKCWLTGTVLIGILTGSAVAQVSSPAGTPLPQAAVSGVLTSRGPALVGGGPGLAPSVMVPGPGAPGTLINNGNGTGWILVPGAAPQAVPAPRQ
jgi:hypothetical protein